MTEAIPHPDEVRMFPALKLMERQLPPQRYGRPPFWRPAPLACSEDAYTPVWNWVSPHEFPEGESVTVLDTNAAYLAAIGSAKLAHSQLHHHGAMDSNPEPRQVLPGYYRIVVPHWAFSATIVSPLGDSSRLQTESTMWVAAPTLTLLLELEREGHLGQVNILDSWASAVTCDFRSWASRLNSMRTELMDRKDRAQDDTQRERVDQYYDAFKKGYSAALSMMLTGENCLTRRPDWTHTVHAQHTSAQWRKAWRWTYTGAPLIAMGATDEISVLSKDLPSLAHLSKQPFRYDPTGRAAGAFKPKRTTVISCQPSPERAAPIEEDGLEDLL